MYIDAQLSSSIKDVESFVCDGDCDPSMFVWGNGAKFTWAPSYAEFASKSLFGLASPDNYCALLGFGFGEGGLGIIFTQCDYILPIPGFCMNRCPNRQPFSPK